MHVIRGCCSGRRTSSSRADIAACTRGSTGVSRRTCITGPDPLKSLSHFGGMMLLRKLAAAAFTLLSSAAAAQPWINGAGGAIYYNLGKVGVGITGPDATLQVVGSPSQVL